MDISKVEDSDLLFEIGRRFEEKQSSIEEMEFLTKKLLDMNEKSKKAQEVKSQFLSLVKNEFNNPVSSLLSVADMLKGSEDIEKVHMMGDLLKRDLLKMDFSLKNIFAASEIEAGEVANEYSVVNIEDLYKEVVIYFEYLISDKNLNLNFENLCEKEIISDSSKLYLILLNLISNACEYSYENSKVEIKVQCKEKSFKIIVQDYGEGIKEEHTKEIYNRFTHFETGNTRGTAGLGLGLSVAKGMCEALDGYIDNISQTGNTVFTITMPYVDKKDIELSTAFGANEFMFDGNSDEMVEF